MSATLSRRALLLGSDEEPGAEPAVVSSLIVQLRPEAMAAVSAVIETIAGAEVAADDPTGKLIVVLESADDAALERAVSRIGALRGVLGVNLVFHHYEADADAS